MPAVDPLFYVVQVIYFTLAAILFGLFAIAHRKETVQNGWALSPRFMWLSCLCCSSSGFLIVQIDPVGALGIFSDPWQLFVGKVDATLLVGSVCASIYMYVLIDYKRDSIPLLVTHVWLASNVGAFLLIFSFALTGAITDNNLWFVLCVLLLMLQEVFIFLGIVISVSKATRLLNSLGPVSDYRKQIRKLWLFLLSATIVIVAALINQGWSLPANFVEQWGKPVPITRWEVFQFRLVAGDLTSLLGHMILLYMLRPPKSQPQLTPPSRISRIITRLPEPTQGAQAV